MINTRIFSPFGVIFIGSLLNVGCVTSNPDFLPEAGAGLEGGGLIPIAGDEPVSGTSTTDEMPTGGASTGGVTSLGGMIIGGETSIGGRSSGGSDSTAGVSSGGDAPDPGGDTPSGGDESPPLGGASTGGDDPSGGAMMGGEQPGGDDPSGGTEMGGEQPGGDNPPGGEAMGGGGPVGGTGVIDFDNDGSPEGEDCDDRNPNRSPNLPEVCDGIDNNCDTFIDEQLLNACGRCGLLPVEICDGEDNDCDGQSDERLLNACGACGPLPIEVCDGQDNDCDERSDEGLLNACGRCGDVPIEVCDGEDNDCDRQIDEQLLNACELCGPLPIEICDDQDNDCDGRTDEQVLNACGACGPIPVEVCDGEDNDCDDEVDEQLLNACGRCGALPVEICDGEDNDCDGQTDESLIAPCFVQLTEITAPFDRITRFGVPLEPAQDLNGDHIPDFYTRGRDQDQDGVVFALSSDGALLWSFFGVGDFGLELASAQYYGDGEEYLAIGDPDSNDGRVLLYNGGDFATIVNSSIGWSGGDLAPTQIDGRAGLVISDPDKFNGRFTPLGAIWATMFDLLDGEYVDWVFESYNYNLDIGERVYSPTDVDGDGVNEVITTVNTFNQFDFDRGSILVNGPDQSYSPVFTGESNTNNSFAADLAWGRFDQTSGLDFAFGAPGVEGDDENGEVYLYANESFFSLILGDSNEKIGRSLATLPRPHRDADVLLIGGSRLGEVRVIDFSDRSQDTALFEQDTAQRYGYEVEVSRETAEDGTYRVWVTQRESGTNSKIWVYSAR